MKTKTSTYKGFSIVEKLDKRVFWNFVVTNPDGTTWKTTSMDTITRCIDTGKTTGI